MAFFGACEDKGALISCPGSPEKFILAFIIFLIIFFFVCYLTAKKIGGWSLIVNFVPLLGIVALVYSFLAHPFKVLGGDKAFGKTERKK